MLKKWLIAVDLDGTLFHTDRQISTRTLNAMNRVVEHGHSMVIVTGRSFHSALPRLLSIPDDTRLVCSNGAYEYDRGKKEMVWANYVPSLLAVAIRRKVLEQLPTASFGWESLNGLSYESKFTDEAGGAHTLEQGGFHEALSETDVLKIFVRSPEQRGIDLARTLKEILGRDLEISTSGVPFVEITAKGINKGTALARVASDLGIKPDYTMAFGDNHNDAPMLRWVGESVAMENAIPEIRAMTKHTTLSNANDGVAHFLESKFASD